MHWIAREQPEPFEETRNRGRRTRSLLIRPGNGRPCQAASSRRIGESLPVLSVVVNDDPDLVVLVQSSLAPRQISDNGLRFFAVFSPA